MPKPFSIKFRSELSQFTNSPLWKNHLPINEDVLNKIPKSIKRFDVLIKGLRDQKWSTAIHKNKELSFITINEKRIKELGIRLGQPVEVEISENNDDYGLEMPIELMQELKTNKEVYNRFQTLTPGNQRNLIRLVLQVKNTISRNKKAKAISHHIFELNNNKVDYKRLNELIKQYNNM